MRLAVALVAAALVAAGGTWLALRLALRDGLLAVPNARSSHSRATPSGGGLGIGFAAALLLPLAAWWLAVPWVALVAPAAAVACWCGRRDDRHTLRPRIKFLVLTVAACSLAASAHVDAADVPFVGRVGLGPLALPLTVFWLAGFANLFNFMDGIDGIAGLTAAVTGAVFAIAGLRGGDVALALEGGTLAAAALGFLPWNFPRARIFMGDTGSLVLGLLLADCAVRGAQSGALPFPAGVLALGPFLFDATFTLARRALRGARLSEAHREHVYQRLARRVGRHPPVSLLYAGFAAGTGALALLYADRGEVGRLLSLLVPPASMLAFAIAVVREDARRERLAPGAAPARRE